MTTQTERELIKLDFEQRQRAEQLLDEVATEEGRLSELVYELISLRDQAGRASVQQGEPVAWLEHHKAGDNLNWERVDHPYAKATPLYLATAPQIPRGWQLMPEESTPEMCEAFRAADHDENGATCFKVAYRVLLATAPKPK